MNANETLKYLIRAEEGLRGVRIRMQNDRFMRAEMEKIIEAMRLVQSVGDVLQDMADREA